MKHKVADCDGKWIDISTFTDSRKAMCSKCRAVDSLPLQDFPPDKSDAQDAPEDLPDEADFAAGRELLLVKALALCAFVTAILAAVTVLLR